MKYSVVLQAPFAFPLFWLLAGIGLLAAAAAGFALRYIRTGRFLPRQRPRPFRAVRMFFLRLRYLRALRGVERDFRRSRIDSRESHKRISLIVRRFAQAATGLPFTNMVHSELPRLYPRLANIIGQLYEPEFAYRPRVDVRDMIRQSKELIRRWK